MTVRILDVVVFVGGPLAGRQATCTPTAWPYAMQGAGGGYVLFPEERSAGFVVYVWLGPEVVR